MKKRLLTSLLGIFVGLTAMAQLPVAGKYYRIVNQNPDKSITTEGERYGYAITEDLISNKLKAEPQGDETQYNQFWKYVGGKFQNAQTLRYMTTLYTSQQGETGTAGTNVSFEEKNGSYILICGMPAHADNSNAVVGWGDRENPSNWWKFEEVTVDAAAVKAAQDAYKKQQEDKAALIAIVNQEATIAATVEGYFTDKACTTLKSEYAGMTDAAFKSKMTTDGLPEQVQTMVLTIKNKWKDEFAPSLSERFRVQNYKIYTSCDGGDPSPKTKWVSTQMSDRNNPTGIWTDALQLMYVFVENEIPEGASLKIAGASGSGVIGVFDRDGVELHQGMNIIYCGLDYTTQWIMYTCIADYETPLSSYPEMKIHIEGGNVLGYVNKTNGDEDATNAEYSAMLENAMNLMTAKGKDMNKINFTVMGERGVFEFPVECYRQIWSKDSEYGAKIYKSINFYDELLKWEWSTMGWQARVENGEAANTREQIEAGGGDAIYPTYVNNHAPTMMAENGKNPYSGNSHTGMPGIWAVESSYNAEREDFDTWCAGHESGHNNQHTINLPSSMEASNNYFSNVITYLYGYRMSRGWSFAQNIDNYVAGDKITIFSQRDISITLRMWYNLWLYYHQVGKNKQFTTKLFKSLREDRMNFGGEGWHSGQFGGANKGDAKNSWLKFYKKACDAAGEDLTEYFRMWGFLTPTSEAAGEYIEKIGDKYYAYCGDYSSYYIHCEQKDIDEAIAYVKSKNYPENLQIMFVEDRQIPRLRHDPLADGVKTKPANWGATMTEAEMKAEYGDVGDILTFIDGSAATSSYTYILSGNKITMDGNGGAGFIVYNKDGNIAYLSNKKEFTIPSKLALDGFTIKTINSDGTDSEVPDASLTASDDRKLEILRTAITLSEDFTSLSDETNTMMGLYESSILANLKSYVEKAEAAIKAGNAATYLDHANAINKEVLRIQAEEKVQMPGNNALYSIKIKRPAATNVDAENEYHYLVPGNNKLATTTISGTTINNEAQWAFIPVEGRENTYYVQSKTTKQFIGVTRNEKNNINGFTMEDATADGAWMCYLKSKENGKLCLKPVDGSTNINKDPSHNIAPWGAEDGGSQWEITLVETFDDVTEAKLQADMKQAQALMDEVTEYTLNKDKFELQCTDASAANYISTNQPEATGSNTLDKAIDASTSTYFLSNKSNNAATTEYHNLTVDLGSGKSTNSISFEIIGVARGTATNYATTMRVSGSNNNRTWTEIATLTNMDRTYKSDVLRKGVTKYRYWKFEVLDTKKNTADASAYPWFNVADFKMFATTASFVMKAGYENLPVSFPRDCRNEILNTQSTLEEPMLTPWTIYSTWVSLNDAYEKLKVKAEEVYTSINDINGENAAEGNGAIYDLSGRKLNEANGNGVFIISGKKVIR